MSAEKVALLGLDPGSRATGWGVVEREPGGTLRARAFGTLRERTDAPFSERLREIHEAVRALVREHAPALVAIEEAFFGKSARSALRLGEARGACVVAVALERRPLVALSPALVKKAVAGHGAAPKERVRDVVRALLGLGEDPIALDASDALALAIAAQARQETEAALGAEVAAALAGRGRRARGARARWTAGDLARLSGGGSP